jgi:hypothetical protein
MREWVILSVCLLAGTAAAADAPIRLKDEKPAGKREKLSMGTLFVSAALAGKDKIPVFVYFHGPGWIAEAAAARSGKLAVISVQLGTGSAVYGKPFTDARRLGQLIDEAARKAGAKLDVVGLAGWSAGYGAVRAILRHEVYYKQIRWVVLLDGLHAGYIKDKQPRPADLDVFVHLAKDAAAGKKRFVVTHTRIEPGKYASTTECADYLLAQADVKRRDVTGPGPSRLPQQSEAKQKGLHIIGCAGTTAAAHVDHLHALPALVDLIEGEKK